MRIIVLAASLLFVTGCAIQSTPGAVVRKQLVCVEEFSCKAELAKDCTKGGVLYGATRAVVVEYSCNL